MNGWIMDSHLSNRDGDRHNALLPDGTELAALVAARICHDLVSPVGAIGNGLDLMGELGPSGVGEDLEMVANSAARAAALLKLHRLAFGSAAEGGSAITRRDLVARCAPIAATRRVSWAVSGETGPDLAPATAKLAALMMLAVRGLLGLEGRLHLVLGPTGNLPIAVEAEGARAGWTAEFKALAFGSATDAAPRHVEFLLLEPAARAAGARLEPTTGPGRAGLRALPA